MSVFLHVYLFSFYEFRLFVFLYCAILLALGIVPSYFAISLAPIQLGITHNTEVTKNAPRANRLLLHLSNATFPSLQL